MLPLTKIEIMKDKSQVETKPNGLDEKHQNAVERLRKSKAQLPAKLRSAGNAAGREFVVDDDIADALCRCRLTQIDDQGMEFYDFECFAREILHDTGLLSDAWTRMQADTYGLEINTPEWIDGFIKGALEKFEELAKPCRPTQGAAISNKAG